MAKQIFWYILLHICGYFEQIYLFICAKLLYTDTNLYRPMDRSLVLSKTQLLSVGIFCQISTQLEIIMQTKLIASALIAALALTACSKPAEKAPEAAAQATEAAADAQAAANTAPADSTAQAAADTAAQAADTAAQAADKAVAQDAAGNTVAAEQAEATAENAQAAAEQAADAAVDAADGAAAAGTATATTTKTK